VHGSVAAALIAVQNGASLVRVHDVAATVDALKVWSAVAAVPLPKKKSSGPAMPRWPDED
jgi:dihydropteroate synthase